MFEPARRSFYLVAVLLAAAFCPGRSWGEDAAAVKTYLDRIGQRGLCVLLGEQGALGVPLAQKSELMVFIQSASDEEAATLRRQAEAAGLLGTRVYVQKGDYRRLHLADDLADAVIVSQATAKVVPREEVLRIVRPGGRAWLGATEQVKPLATGTDEWSHPYHGPDNNPQSQDQVARRPFMTHFLAEPWYCPLTQMTVVSGGRMFKVFGDRSSARPQEDLLNKLMAMNSFNGTILWERDLTPGFMIHRNTLIATLHTLFLGDDKSCKLIDPATGKVRDEIVVKEGPTWKWMALENEVLYALVGEKEPLEISFRGDRIRGAGWPWWKYGNYKYGFGRTLLAIVPHTKKVLWQHTEEDKIDGRAVCLKNGRLYYHSENKFLACIDAKTGKVVWKNTDPALLEAIGTAGDAQKPMLGFASSAYMKCSDEALFFGGPQRPRVVAASAKDGKLLWQREGGNSQLVLRPEGLYTLGEGRINSAKSSFKLEPLSGKVLAVFPSRDRCTRATGNADSIFTRGGAGGSTAVFDVASEEPRMGALTPMRPACTDGVVTAHGYLFWGPWMCRCDQTQIGVISLGPGGSFDFARKATEAERLQAHPSLGKGGKEILPLGKGGIGGVNDQDWPTYRKDNARSVVTSHNIPAVISKCWEFTPPQRSIATAPVAAGGLVFISAADGAVRALDAATGKPRWTAYTGGPVKYPPAIWQGRAYIGSGDGWIYCLEAATGRTLWRFRAAPAERVIPVHGSLMSTWPVGSGVLVDNGVAYAAAGIFNYDGTHVYALDAITGKIRWQNNTSGHQGSETTDAGVSVQGHLLLHDGAIHLPGGNKPMIASYAIADGKYLPATGPGRGKHLYVRHNQVSATGFPLYWRPEDDHYLTAMELEIPGGVIGVTETNLSLLAPQADPKAKPRPLWTTEIFFDTHALAVGKNALLVTGVNRDKRGTVTESGLCAVSLADGKVLWKVPLPVTPVAWGLALDRRGRILVTLTDGRVVAFQGK